MPKNEVEFTEYISPDGETYRFDNRIDRFLMSETGYGMPPIEYLSRRGPQQHGSTLYDYRLAQRVIQLIERDNACSRSEYYEHRGTILDLLRPNRQAPGLFELGTLRKGLPDGSERAIDVMIEEGPAFAARDTNVWDEWAFTEAIRFVAPDPTFYDPNVSTALFDIDLGDHLIFPFTFDDVDLVFSAGFLSNLQNVIYNGTWLTYPIITINGPIDGFLIKNISTREELRMNYGVSTGETVTIDLSYGVKTVTNSAGVNLIGTISSDSDLVTFHLACDPEVDCGINQIVVKGSNCQGGATSVSVDYYERYIGL